MGSHAADSDDSYGTGPTIRPMKIPNDSAETPATVVISHVESPSLFYVYLHAVKYDLDKELNIFMKQYKTMFTFQHPPLPRTTCVCCYSVDFKWYRGVVLDWETDDNNALSLKVYFCDYGNTEDVKWEECLIYRLPSYFAAKSPMQAIPCAMYRSLPSGAREWNDDEINSFYRNLSDYTDSFQKTAKCKFYLSPRLDNLVFVDFTEHKSISAESLTSGVGRKWNGKSLELDYLATIRSLTPDYLNDVKPIRFPPTVHNNPPAVHNNPPAVHRNPPAVHRNPLAVLNNPPAVHSNPPSVHSNPPALTDRSTSSKPAENESETGKLQPRICLIDSDKKTANRVILRHLGMMPIASSSEPEASRKKSRKTVEEPEKARKSDSEHQHDLEDTSHEEHDRSGACSPLTTMACQPPDLPTEYPEGSLRCVSRWSNLPDLVVPCGPDKHFSVIMCDAQHPNKFFVNLCTKETSKMMSWLEAALNHHYDWYSEKILNKFFDGIEFGVGDIVCAETDSFFARAVVEEIQRVGPAKELFANLFYIDFGYHAENVPLKKIHILSPEYFFHIPAQAIECTLSGIEPLHKPWTSMDKNTFTDICGETDNHGSVEGLSIFIDSTSTEKNVVSDGPLEVYLTHTNATESINSLICSGDNPIAQMIESSGETLKENSSPDNTNEEEESSSHDRQKWDVTEIIYRQSLTQQADKRRAGKGETYQICHFYKIRGRCMWGNKCKMLHTREDFDGDQVDRRIEFERNVSKMEQVSFLDTGAFMHYPKRGAWTGILVTAIYQPNRFYVQLIHGPVDYLKRPEYAPEDWDFNAPKTYNSLTELTNEMNFIYNEMDPPDLIHKLYASGELVAARARDDNWYRATVVDHDSDSDDVIVKLLDTGDVDSIRQAWVQPLNNRFLTGLPVQAFECFLTNVERPTTGWSNDAWRKIVNFLDGQPLHAHVDDVLPTGILNLTVWDAYKKPCSDHVCINQSLLQEGHAISKPTSLTSNGTGNLSGPWRCPDEEDILYYPG